MNIAGAAFNPTKYNTTTSIQIITIEVSKLSGNAEMSRMHEHDQKNAII